MSYEVLARKYRSRTFDEIVGQAAIATTLKNAVARDRIHHGYLFTGTRGVGKTSMARILAKALNCLSSDGPTANPCCECDSCVRIASGDDMDVVEIDAASNTGVDNIRELRSNAAFRPVRGRFKIYIIDEVHMLSAGAFNALLKTLEEPPDHVKFILATTESHKVPATIQSRCQRFNFRSIGAAEIGSQLVALLAAEGVAADEAVVRRVARLANGSMRDALSILDQLLAFGSSELTSELMEDLLPSAHNELVTQLVDAVGADDAAAALNQVDEILSSGYTPPRLCDAMIEHLRALMLMRICGEQTDLIDAPSGAREQLAAQSNLFDPATFVYMISLMEQVRRQLQTGGASRALLDAVVVRLAMSSSFTRIDEVLARIDGTGGGGARQSPVPAKKKDLQRDVKAQGSLGESQRPVVQPVSPSVGDQDGASQTVGAVAKRSTGGKRGTAGQSSRRTVGAAQRQEALKSPLVRKVVELTNGRIVDIRSAGDIPPGSATNADR